MTFETSGPAGPADAVPTPDEIASLLQVEHLLDQRWPETKIEPSLSKFEVLTAMAFAAFADAPVDVAVVEVGLGGRWDATNVINAPVAVITPISVDHVEYLGDDIGGIAGEKAGIISKAPGGSPDSPSSPTCAAGLAATRPPWPQSPAAS